MNIETVNKIKNNINSKFAELFIKADLESNRFVPINKQAGFFYVVVPEQANKSAVSEFIASKDKDTLKFISLDESSFNDLLNYYVSSFYSEANNSETAASNNETQNVEKPKVEFHDDSHKDGAGFEQLPHISAHIPERGQIRASFFRRPGHQDRPDLCRREYGPEAEPLLRRLRKAAFQRAAPDR